MTKHGRMIALFVGTMLSYAAVAADWHPYFAANGPLWLLALLLLCLSYMSQYLSQRQSTTLLYLSFQSCLLLLGILTASYSSIPFVAAGAFLLWLTGLVLLFFHVEQEKQSRVNFAVLMYGAVLPVSGAWIVIVGGDDYRTFAAGLLWLYALAAMMFSYPLIRGNPAPKSTGVPAFCVVFLLIWMLVLKVTGSSYNLFIPAVTAVSLIAIGTHRKASIVIPWRQLLGRLHTTSSKAE